MKVGKKERTKARNWEICKERKFARTKLSKKSNKQKKEGNQQLITPGFKCLNKKSLFIFIFRFILISCALSWCSLSISHFTYLSAKLFHYLWTIYLSIKTFYHFIIIIVVFIFRTLSDIICDNTNIKEVQQRALGEICR